MQQSISCTITIGYSLSSICACTFFYIGFKISVLMTVHESVIVQFYYI